LSKKNEQETLLTQITEAIEMIDLIPEVPSDLEQRLADIQASLDSSQSNLSDEVNTTEVIDALIDTASASQVSVVFISTTPWSLVNIEGYNYLIFTVNLDIEGGLYNISAFLRNLESIQPPPISVEYLNITRDEELMGSSAMVTASLDMVLYARPPVTAQPSLTDSD
jgi:hypothetical protein